MIRRLHRLRRLLSEADYCQGASDHVSGHTVSIGRWRDRTQERNLCNLCNLRIIISLRLVNYPEVQPQMNED